MNVIDVGLQTISIPSIMSPRYREMGGRKRKKRKKVPLYSRRGEPTRLLSTREKEEEEEGQQCVYQKTKEKIASFAQHTLG